MKLSSNKLNNYINYCPHHIKSGAPVEQIPVDDIKSKLGFNYINSSLSDSWRSVLEVFLPEKPLIYKCEDGLKILQNPEEILVVHEASPYIGRGLTTLDVIERCTIIIEYSGDIVPEKENDVDYALVNGFSKKTLAPVFNKLSSYENKDQYRLQLARDYLYKAIVEFFEFINASETINDKNVSITMIDAKENGNLARFAVHMPSDEGIFKGYKVATASLSSICLPSMVGYVKCFLFSLRDIQVNEELGFDYGKNYRFPDKAGPLYFDSETNLLINRNGTLHNPNFDYIDNHVTTGNIAYREL